MQIKIFLSFIKRTGAIFGPGALFISLFLSSAGVDAHHSFAAEFDYDRSGEIQGEVIEVLFVNPHARYFIAVTNADGEEEIWDAQTMSVSFLSRNGWSSDTIRSGETVTLQGNLGRGDGRKLWIREVTLEDGTKIFPVADGASNEE